MDSEVDGKSSSFFERPRVGDGQGERETNWNWKKKQKVFQECCKSAGWGRPTLVSGHLWHSHLNRLLQHLHWANEAKLMESSLNIGEKRSSHLTRPQTLATSLTHAWDKESRKELEIIEHVADSYFNIMWSTDKGKTEETHQCLLFLLLSVWVCAVSMELNETIMISVSLMIALSHIHIRQEKWRSQGE